MNGALPPSSSDSFLTVPAHCAIRILPTSVDPVNDSLRTMGLAVSSPPISVADPVTMLSTPFGTPARSASSPSASAENGVCDAGLRTTVQPAAIAGPALRVIIASGKFHGVMQATTPIGSLTTTMRLSDCGPGIVSPYTRFASSPNHSRNDAAYATSPRDSASGLPCSVVISVARSSWFAIISSNQRRITFARSFAVLARHAGSARAAASIAARVSAAVNFGTVPMTSPVAGLSTSIVARPATHTPST